MYVHYIYIYILYKIGINAAGIRKVIKAPSRYAIPIIVSTGLPYNNSNTNTLPWNVTKQYDRYTMDEMMFGDYFESPLPTK